MYKIRFYKDKDGIEPTQEYIRDLGLRNDKDSRIKFNKIMDYMDALAAHGLGLGEPYIKHIESGIWELRP